MVSMANSKDLPHIVPTTNDPVADTTGMDVADGSADQAAKTAVYASTTIVQAWSKPFDLEGLWAAADEEFLNDKDEGGMQVEDDASGFVPDEGEAIADDEE